LVTRNLGNLRIPLLALVLAAAIGAGCCKPDIREGMVRLDRAYIPALSLTNDADTLRSKTALAFLAEEWRAFRERYGNLAPSDKEWQADLGRAEALIQRASLLADPGSLAPAHEELESVRNVMRGLRRRNGIQYLHDYLTDFHDVMERLVLAGVGRDPNTLSPAVLDNLAADYVLAREAWSRVESVGVDKTLFGFDEQELATAGAHIRAESESLDRLAAALGAQDRAAVVRAAVGVKP
jgi:hypothetical protein